MNEETNSKLKRPKRFTILASGTNRGFKANVSAITNMARTPSNEIVVTTVDPEPGRAAEAAALVEERGLVARPIADQIENVAADEPADVIMNQTDRAGSLAHALTIAEQRNLPLLAYLIIAFRERLLGLEIAVGSQERVACAGVRACCETLERLTTRGGSEHVTGERAPVRFQIAEDGMREAFARHAKENLSKIAAGREPVAHPVEAIWDGVGEGVPAIIVQRDAIGAPSAVVREALRGYSTPIPWDSNVLVIEVLPDALVFHEVRKAYNGIVTVQGSSSLDAASIAEVREMSALSEELAVRRDFGSGIDAELVANATSFLLSVFAEAARAPSTPRAELAPSTELAVPDEPALEVRSSTYVTSQAPVRTTD